MVAVTERRFPPPWSVEETDACFIVRDHNGQALAYVYFEDESGRRSAAKLLTKDEATRNFLMLRLFDAASCQDQAARRDLRLGLGTQQPNAITRRVFHNACACLVSAKKR
jgi:hypothetical protein